MVDKPLKSKKKLLCWCDAPFIPTGFGTVAKYVVKELYKTGLFDIDWLAINYYGEFYDKERYPYQLSPARLLDPQDPYGKSMFLRSIDKGDYDFVWILNDCPVVQPVVKELKKLKDKKLKEGKKFPKIILYYPVDCTTVPEQTEMIRLADVAVTITEYGRQETLRKLNNLDKDIKVVPHGIDPSVHKPISEEERSIVRRKYLGIKDDKTFLWIQVNRNSIRKNIAHSILAFKEFKKKVPNSKYYIHCMPRDNGLDMILACNELGLDLKEDVVFPANFSIQKGGFPPEVVNGFVSAADGFISTTLGEGYGISTAESIAAGTPVVIGDHTSTCEILGKDGERGYIYPCKETTFIDSSGYRPLGQINDIVGKMYQAYKERGTDKQEKMIQRGLDWAQHHTWEEESKGFIKIFNDLIEKQNNSTSYKNAKTELI